MATPRWLGGAPAVAQVTTWQLSGTWEATDLIRATIGTRSVDFVVGSTVISTIVDTLVAAWNALSATNYPEYAEMTASKSGADTLVLTADTAGVPFAVTLTPLETGGGAADDQRIAGGTTAAPGTTTVANAGPYVYGTPANWSDATLPVDGDDLVVEDSAYPILYGLAQSSIDLASLTIRRCPAGFSIGLPAVNADGNYPEYRDTYLAIHATAVVIDAPLCGRIKLDTGTAQTGVTVRDLGPPVETGIPALCWKGTHASNALAVLRGTVGVAFFAADAATLATLETGYVASVETDASVTCGPGADLSSCDVTQAGGTISAETDVDTLVMTAGSFSLEGIATLAAATIGDVATLYYSTSGTLTAATIDSGGTIDLTSGTADVTFTAVEMLEGATLRDPARRLVRPLTIRLRNCDTSDVTVDVGDDLDLTIDDP